MGSKRFSVPAELLQDISRSGRWTVAVETGTYLGEGSRILASHFGEVWTIESDAELAQNAESLMHSLSLANVHIVHGSSEAVLAGVLAEIEQPAVFWLDAHWFPRLTPNDNSQCPIFAELQVIADWDRGADSCVLIDDMSLFREELTLPGYRQSEWPKEVDVLKFVESRFPDHRIQFWEEEVMVLLPGENQEPRI